MIKLILKTSNMLMKRNNTEEKNPKYVRKGGSYNYKSGSQCKECIYVLDPPLDSAYGF